MTSAIISNQKNLKLCYSINVMYFVLKPCTRAGIAIVHYIIL